MVGDLQMSRVMAKIRAGRSVANRNKESHFYGSQPMKSAKSGFLMAASAALITTGFLMMSGPGYAATQNADERRDARDTRQDTRQGSRKEKVDCRKADQKSNSECRQENRDNKQEGRKAARDIKY
jgi:hypothetical protein